MPQIIYHRLWCKTCENWKPFGKKWEMGKLSAEPFCIDCDTEHVPTLLSEIPDEKILAQRKRYRQHKSNQFRSVMNLMGSFGSVADPGISVIESDAGYEQEQTNYRMERKRRQDEHNALVASHKHMGRNDSCLCGSGKKYKRCCQSLVKP